MLALFANVALSAGSIIFSLFMKESEFRFILIISCIVNFVGAFLTMLFCLEITFGLPDFIFVALTTTVTDILS
jgi:hypothetical protein